MKRKSVLTILIVLSLCFAFLVSCSEPDTLAETDGFYMGTVVSAKAFGTNPQEAVKEAMARIEDIENKMAINIADNELDRLNTGAGSGVEVALSMDTLLVLNTAQKYSRLSEGAFDVTIGPLIKAWGFLEGLEEIPSEEEINQGKALVDYQDLEIDLEAMTARLRCPGQIIDLGGIAKGYAGDEAIRIYQKNKIKSAYINLGGNVVTLGGRPDGGPWNVGLKDPRANDGSSFAVLKIKDKAVVTSGDYERYFIKDNLRYHHILDPKTGKPARSGLISATIVAESSIVADALSTATFILGLEKSMDLLEGLSSVEGIFVTEDQEVYLTPGIKDAFILTNQGRHYQVYEKK